MNKRKLFFTIILLAAVFSLFFIGCSDSTTSPPTTGGGSSGFIPTMRITQGARYIYTNDSLINNNGNITTQRTNIITYDTVRAPIVIQSDSCYPITSTSIGNGQTLRDTMYVRYDSTAGKVYQYGIQQFINPLQPPSWDLAADFSIARNTTWNIGTINISYTFPAPIGAVTFSGPLTGKVADSTTVNTTATPSVTVHCYRIELNANISGSVPNVGTVSASIFIDYFLGYYSASFPNNPSGIVRITFRPFSFNASGVPVLYQSGVDRILRNYMQ